MSSANVDAAGVAIRRGHTVHLGASTGLVEGVYRGFATVRWISGVTQYVACDRLTVVRSLGVLSAGVRERVPAFLSGAL